jgi:hypothetical protein
MQGRYLSEPKPDGRRAFSPLLWTISAGPAVWGRESDSEGQDCGTRSLLPAGHFRLLQRKIVKDGADYLPREGARERSSAGPNSSCNALNIEYASVVVDKVETGVGDGRRPKAGRPIAFDLARLLSCQVSPLIDVLAGVHLSERDASGGLTCRRESRRKEKAGGASVSPFHPTRDGRTRRWKREFTSWEDGCKQIALPTPPSNDSAPPRRRPRSLHRRCQSRRRAGRSLRLAHSPRSSRFRQPHEAVARQDRLLRRPCPGRPRTCRLSAPRLDCAPAAPRAAYAGPRPSATGRPASQPQALDRCSTPRASATLDV